MATQSYWQMVKETFSEYSEDKVPRLAAALAYYTIFAIAPLLIIAIAVAGFVMDKVNHNADAAGQVYSQLDNLMGRDGGNAMKTVVEKVRQANHRGSGMVATIVSIVVLLFGASGVFGELQDSMNTIWEVKPKEQGFWGMLRSRFLSFAMVMGVAFLLLTSLVVSAVITGAVKLLGIGVLAQIANIVVSLIVVTGLFAMIFKVLPDVNVRWKDVWIGAVATAVLFTLGKYLIGLYLGRSTTASVFGAAGSLVALLVWVYYSAQILFLGAEFTQVYARRTGSRIEPSQNAERVTEEDRAQAGISRGADSNDKKEPAWYPAVPVNRALATPSAAPASGGGSKLVPLLVGVALGKLLLGGKKKSGGRGFAPARIVEPGWVSRSHHPAELKEEYVIRVKTPEVVKKAARQFNRGYHAARNRISEYIGK